MELKQQLDNLAQVFTDKGYQRGFSAPGCLSGDLHTCLGSYLDGLSKDPIPRAAFPIRISHFLHGVPGEHSAVLCQFDIGYNNDQGFQLEKFRMVRYSPTEMTVLLRSADIASLQQLPHREQLLSQLSDIPAPSLLQELTAKAQIKHLPINISEAQLDGLVAQFTAKGFIEKFTALGCQNQDLKTTILHCLEQRKDQAALEFPLPLWIGTLIAIRPRDCQIAKFQLDLHPNGGLEVRKIHVERWNLQTGTLLVQCQRELAPGQELPSVKDLSRDLQQSQSMGSKKINKRKL